jgi:DNA modification methylase
MQNQTTLPATPVHGIVTMPFAPYYDEGGITIYNADCRQVLPFLPKFDLLLTDPPYGIGERLVKGGSGHSFDSLIKSGADAWDVKVEPWLLSKLMEQTENQIIWGGNFYQLPPCDQPLCWDKVRPNQKNLSEWEYAWTSFVGRARLFAYCGNGGFVAKEARVHPTQKPLALMRWCLSIAKDAETIIDPFAGSGTTGAACKLEGRKAVLIEISEEYCEKAADRLRQGVLF